MASAAATEVVSITSSECVFHEPAALVSSVQCCSAELGMFCIQSAIHSRHSISLI